jgi:hypothetical protein
MERSVPTGTSLRGCGTLTGCPTPSRSFAWLPRWDTNPNPFRVRMRMNAPRNNAGHGRDKRSGDRQPAHGYLGDHTASFPGLILQKKLHRPTADLPSRPMILSPSNASSILGAVTRAFGPIEKLSQRTGILCGDYFHAIGHFPSRLLSFEGRPGLF